MQSDKVEQYKAKQRKVSVELLERQRKREERMSKSEMKRRMIMSEEKKEETPVAPPQPSDLAHQKPEETDNLNKSERPADDYLKSRDLDADTLGKKKE